MPSKRTIKDWILDKSPNAIETLCLCRGTKGMYSAETYGHTQWRYGKDKTASMIRRKNLGNTEYLRRQDKHARLD